MDHFKNVFSLEGRTALIVGGGGLGLPIAQALMENGGMQGLAEKLGFSVVRNYDEEVAEMRLPLNDPGPGETAVA